jgi:hypothetical protein
MAQFDKRTSIVLAIVGACTLNMPLVFVSQPVFGRMQWTALELKHSSHFTGAPEMSRSYGLDHIPWIHCCRFTTPSGYQPVVPNRPRNRFQSTKQLLLTAYR